MTDMTRHVEEMVSKAAKADTSEDAMRFSQAACNAANAMSALCNNRKTAAGDSGLLGGRSRGHEGD